MSLQELLVQYAQKHDISIRAGSKLFEDKTGKLYFQVDKLWLEVVATAGTLSIIETKKQDKRKLKLIKNIAGTTWNGVSHFDYSYGD